MARHQATETSIALIHKDIAFIKDSMKKVTETLEKMEKDYIKRSEVESLARTVDKHAQVISIQELNLSNFMTQVKTWGAIGSVALSIASAAATTTIIKALN